MWPQRWYSDGAFGCLKPALESCAYAPRSERKTRQIIHADTLQRQGMVSPDCAGALRGELTLDDSGGSVTVALALNSRPSPCYYIQRTHYSTPFWHADLAPVHFTEQ